ncbi:helix-turn-helix transcriptional regulator [Sphaerisporangium sp. TRM90804]|uniref:helix-turn-helix domain-containing protein n=1 Tax=Sphaerisporangium sp. TRM90804 TaxID=3031113 RepID=UPI00244785F1|nr:helix-turn-helix transcriptional regulator [Sphaerisporangium sp. TRM90804]MDH2427561.1 helix-turn-helix transcriptional regulator [Sphaerisporangium sp. TRM90804]
MPQPVELNPEASPLARFGFEVRRHRVAASLTQGQLARLLLFSTSMVGMVERAERKPERAFAQRCDEIFRLDGTLSELWLMADRWKDAAPSWFRHGLDAEQEATAVRSWDPLLVYGLMQTEAYARHVLAGEPGITPELLEQRLATRLQRKSILTKADPPTVWAIIDEGVLHRPIGDPTVMRRQLEYLLEIAEHPRVKIQVLPFEAQSTCGLMSAFVITELPGHWTTVWAESSIQGTVTDDPQTVKAITDRYDALRVEALPRHMSLRIISKEMSRWI